MYKKLLIGVLAASMALTAAIGFSACESGGGDGNDQEQIGGGTLKPILPQNPVEGTKGLKYTLSKDATYYTAAGIGSCSETEIVIGNVCDEIPVTRIGDYAFYNCMRLKSITIGDGVTGIGKKAFRGCSGLVDIRIPNSVTVIESYAFWGCSQLASITIPNSVTNIGEFAFGVCGRLTNIVFQGTKTEWGSVKTISDWDYNTGDYTVQCTDGKLDKNGKEIE